MPEGRSDASAEEQKLIQNKLRNKAAGKNLLLVTQGHRHMEKELQEI